MTQSIQIRAFSPNDLEAVAQVDSLAFGNDCYPPFFFRQAFDVFGDLLQIAEDEKGEVVGYTLGAIQLGSSTGWVLSLAVKPAVQKKGIATLLTHTLIQTLISKEVQNIKLTVKPDNYGALKLYKNIGFTELHTVENYFGHKESRLLMQKKLLSLL